MESDTKEGDAARLAAFCTLCTVNAVHDVIQTVAGGIEQIDPELLAEETLCMLSAVTSMAVAHGVAGDTGMRDSVVEAVSELPHLYRDYLFGVSIMMEGDREDLAERAGTVTARLRRKQEFYAAHLPRDQFPSERILKDKLGLWMGRVSPPGLPKMPDQRLEELGLTGRVLAHTRVIIAYLRNATAPE